MTANIRASTELEEEAGGGITLFGVTLSTKILGIILAVIGVLGAGYITVNLTLPLKDQLDKQQAEIEVKKVSVTQKQQQVNSKGDISSKVEAARARNQAALSLLPDPNSMDVLLRDINAQLPEKIILSNAIASLEIKNALEEYKPSAVVATTGGDTQFRTRTYSIQFSATYPEAIKIMRNIERLRPLLVVKNLSLKKNDKVFIRDTKLTPEQQKAVVENLPPLLTTNFNLVAYVPLSDAELQAADQKAAEAAAKVKK